MLELKITGQLFQLQPTKTTKLTSSPPPTITMITAAATTLIILSTNQSPKPETGDHPNKEEERRTQVTRWGKKKSPLKALPVIATTSEEGKIPYLNNDYYRKAITIINNSNARKK